MTESITNKKEFGMALRGARLGYQKLNDIGYVRIVGSGPFDIHLVNSLDRMKPSPQDHICWWDNADFSRMLRPILAPFAGMNEVSIKVDDCGTILENKRGTP